MDYIFDIRATLAGRKEPLTLTSPRKRGEGTRIPFGNAAYLMTTLIIRRLRREILKQVQDDRKMIGHPAWEFDIMIMQQET